LDALTYGRARIVLGPQHPSTMACQLNLSLDLAALERGGEAQVEFDATMEKFLSVFGATHPATVAAGQRQRANCDADPMPL